MLKKDLYIIQSYKTGAFKVGVTKNIKERLKKVADEYPLTINNSLLPEDTGSIKICLYKSSVIIIFIYRWVIYFCKSFKNTFKNNLCSQNRDRHTDLFSNTFF